MSNREDGWQVWTARGDGTDLRRVTREQALVGWPSWSPDGSAILYYGQRGGAYRLLTIDLRTGVVSGLDAAAAESFRPLLDIAGERLLFDRSDPGNPRNHDIYVHGLQTGEVQRLTDDPGYDSDARWSPDQRRIVFHSDRTGERGHLQTYVMGSDGGSMRQVTSGLATNAYPSWSPNGKCIVYTSESEGNRDLWVVEWPDKVPQRLTWHHGFDSEPVWSAGGRVLFVTDRYGGAELAFLESSKSLVQACEA